MWPKNNTPPRLKPGPIRAVRQRACDIRQGVRGPPFTKWGTPWGTPQVATLVLFLNTTKDSDLSSVGLVPNSLFSIHHH
jgi:hypothetical protein